MAKGISKEDADMIKRPNILIRKLIGIFLLIAPYLPSFTQAAQLELFSTVDLFSYSDANIHEDDWFTLGPYQPGEISFIYSTAEVGFKWRKWKFSGISRYDYWTEFNEETGEILYLKTNSLELDKNRLYNIDITANHIRAKGIKFGYEWLPFKNITTSVAVSYLNADRLIDGNIYGQARELRKNRYEGDLYVDFSATQDFVFEGTDSAHQGKGRGYTVDIHTQWKINKIAELTLQINDLYSAITWDNVENADYRINPRKPEIVDGTLVTYASAYGRKGRGKFTQHLPMRINMQGRYLAFRYFHLLAEINHFEPVTIPRLGVSLSFTPNTHLDFYYSSFDAYEIAFNSKYFWLSIQADQSFESAESIDKLLTAGVKIGFSIPLY